MTSRRATAEPQRARCRGSPPGRDRGLEEQELPKETLELVAPALSAQPLEDLGDRARAQLLFSGQEPRERGAFGGEAQPLRKSTKAEASTRILNAAAAPVGAGDDRKGSGADTGPSGRLPAAL
jgi:hypothetical protein